MEDENESYFVESSSIEENPRISMENSDNNNSGKQKSRIRKGKNKTQSTQKVDVKAKLERSRQSARECRARKKLRYQYLEDMVNKRENANLILKKEIEQLKEVYSMLSSDQHSLDDVKKHYEKINGQRSS